MISKEFHRHANSEVIRTNHKAVYEALYQACPTVVSVPAVVVWSPNYAVGSGGIGITSKLPFRFHVGIEPKTEPGIEFGPTKYYIPERDEFEDWDPTRCDPIFLQLLEASAKKFGKHSGARIWCVSEVPWYRGLNVDPLYAVATAAAWLLHLGAVASGELSEMVKLPSHKLRDHGAFRLVYHLALKLESVIANWIADGHMTFGIMIDSGHPVVFFREKDPFFFDHYYDLGIDNPASYYNAGEGLFYRGARLNEIVPINPDPAWPIDIALVFTGEEGDSRFVYQSRRAIKSKLDEVSQFTEKYLEGLVPQNFRSTPSFMEMTHDTPNQSAGMNLYEVGRRVSVAHSLTVFKSLCDLFQFGGSAEALREFFSGQTVCQSILRILGLSPHAINFPQNILQLVGYQHQASGVASRLIGPGVHGCIMVIGPATTLESVMNEALAKIKGNNPNTVHCHYASWCDGSRVSDGLRVEQYVPEKRYSIFTASKSVTVIEVRGGAPPVALLMTTEKFEQEKPSFDLLFDRRENKIYVRGAPLTSAQIHSAKQTIEIVTSILQRGGREMRATELPPSIYSSDRNQMESKIIRPICTAVKQITNRPLGLEIHGGLATNFIVQFNPDPHLRIGFVEKT